MKRLSKSINNEETDIDITPMLDVVFIMLIFFIVTASFVKESGIGFYSPPVSEPKPIETQPIIVEITNNGEIKIQGRTVDHRAVKPTIIRLKAENQDSSVIVKVDKQARTKLIVQVVDGIRGAKVLFPSISLVKG